jgi:hypothetical protein
VTVVYVLAAALIAVAVVRQLWRANRKVNAALATVQAPAPARTADPAPKENTTA